MIIPSNGTKGTLSTLVFLRYFVRRGGVVYCVILCGLQRVEMKEVKALHKALTKFYHWRYIYVVV